jgi:tetratricopeptide (TPR) repeat protein
MQTQVSPDVEPTREFNEQCTKLITGWQQGKIAADDALQELKILAREALTDGHIANQARAEQVSAYLQHYVGNLSISIAHYDKARRLFDRVGNRRRVVIIDIGQGENYRYRGEFKRARRLYRMAYEAAEQIKDISLQSIAITNEGLTLLNMKEYAASRSALEEGLYLSEQITEDDGNYDALRTEIFFGLAEVALAEDKPAEAWEKAHHSLEHSNISENRHSMGLAYRVLGDALTALGTVPEDSDYQKPDDYYRAALETFKNVDAQAEVGRTIYSHALSLAKRGRRRHAAQLFREAMVTFTQLSMTADAADAADAQLQVM